MGFESFSGQVGDDDDPNTALDIAAQAVRDFNHRTMNRMQIDKPGWQFVADVYQALGEMTALIGGLSQAFGQLSVTLHDQLEQNLIVIDRGARYEDHPDRAVGAAQVALERAKQASHYMYRGVADAQTAIHAAAYAGPDVEEITQVSR